MISTYESRETLLGKSFGKDPAPIFTGNSNDDTIVGKIPKSLLTEGRESLGARSINKLYFSATDNMLVNT